jgi:acetylornithine deacetylase
MNAPALYDMLETLVAAPSVSCTSTALDQSNLGVIHHLAQWLEGLGFDADVTPLPDKPGKANLIATLGSGEGGLVLAGHTDTVPCNPDRWSQDPFALTERGGRLYGLGSCDMKGFFPIAIEAARAFRAAHLAKPLTILATSDEESTMAGARALVAGGRPCADFAIIGEPTDLMPVYAHKGFMMIAIRLTGASGHSSDPDLGRNALDAMHCAMGELIAFRAELATQHRDADFEVAVPTLNLGCLTAGDNPNRICGQAELQIDLRILPGMDSEHVLERLTERLRRSAASHDVAIDVIPVSPPVPPFSSPRDGRLVRMLERLCGRAGGVVAFGTEGPFLQQLGMETVIFGPGAIDQAHQPDEFLDGTRIDPTVAILRQVIQDVCGRN